MPRPMQGAAIQHRVGFIAIAENNAGCIEKQAFPLLFTGAADWCRPGYRLNVLCQKLVVKRGRSPNHDLGIVHGGQQEESWVEVQYVIYWIKGSTFRLSGQKK